jgi:hypothetical protein
MKSLESEIIALIDHELILSRGLLERQRLGILLSEGGFDVVSR